MQQPPFSDRTSVPGGMQPDQMGLILQRGGEELRLSKSGDRFTTQLTSTEAVAAVVSALGNLPYRPVARGQLLEWTVPSHRLEVAIAQARALPQVSFVSHVYHLQASPQTFVYLTNQLTLQFAPQASSQVIHDLTRSLGLALLNPIEAIPKTFVFQVTATAQDNPIKLANRLVQRSDVLTAEPNIVVETESLYQPSDPLYSRQWHLFHNGGTDLANGSHTFAAQAWDITRGSRSIIIAVTDDAFDLSHPDLQGLGKIVAPQDLKDRDALPLPNQNFESHGTAVAGLALGEENGNGIVGVAPGCALMPIRTTGFLDDESIEQLFSWAIQNNAAVISCSWSPATVYFPLSLRQRQAITKAATVGRGGKGCVVVFSAGNANRPVSGTINEQGWPNNALKGVTSWLSGFAVHPDVIAVSASTSLNRKAAYSNWGDHIAVAAPSNNAPPAMALPSVGTVSTGPSIQTTLPGRGMVTSDRTGSEGYDASAYTYGFGGTSSSCPVVAGVVGLMLSANPDLTAKDVRQILQQTADKIIDPTPDPQLGLRYGTYDQNGHSAWFGFGKVNALKAVQEAQKRQASRRLQRTVTVTNTTPVAIPDNQPAGGISKLEVPETEPIQDLQVWVHLEHEYLGDVALILIVPGGEAIRLQGRTLGRQTRLQTTYSISNTPAFRTLMGRSLSGTWQLKAVDSVPLNTGRIREWALVLGV